MRNRRREADRTEWEKKRGLILEAATECFASGGKEGVSMRDVGKAADLHMSTLYHYFANKDSLYDAVIELTFSSTADLVLASLKEQGAPEQKVQRMIRAICDYFLSNTPQVRLLEREFLHYNSVKTLHHPVPAVMGDPIAAVSQVLTELKPPILSKLPADRLGEMLWDLTWGISRHSSVHAIFPGRTHAVDREKVQREVWTIVETVLNIKGLNGT